MDCAGAKPLPVLTLVNEKTRECYDVLKKKINLITRAGFKGDFEIPDDSSISRCHAEIFYEKKVVNNEAKLFLKLVDKKSKFGTFLNNGITSGERIATECPIVLSLGDRIRFGIMNSFWIVTEYPFLVCPSTLKKSDKKILMETMSQLGGNITPQWTNQCTHLCMNSISLTEKVLICLASAKSIVPIRYFIDLRNALLPSSTTELPYCTDYVPDLIENLLNLNSVSMDVNNKRKTLFSGKTFVCSTLNQYNRISKIITIAGGEIIKYSEDMSVDKIVRSKEHIVMQKDPSNTENNKKYQQLLEKLNSMDKTLITENDIGLAVIYSSTAKHCNPDYNNSLINLQTQSSVTESHASRILAPETEVLTVEDSSTFSVNVVPDSLSHTQPCFKRPLEIIDSEEIMMPKKRGLFSNDIENPNIVLKTRAEENTKPTMSENLLIPSSSNLNVSHYNNTVVKDKSINSDLCVTTIQSSQNSSNNYDYSSLLQVSIANESMSNINSLHSETMNNRASTKRKISSVGSIANNEDDDPFNYKDIDEIEEHTTKKPKTKPPVSLFYSMLKNSSSNKSEPPKPVEPKVNNTVDPNFIMDLLSSAKGTGKCINTSNLDDKSSIKTYEDDYLLNSVIVETVNMVKSESESTENKFQCYNSNLKNFKKFKKKAKAMQIPHIVPMHLI